MVRHVILWTLKSELTEVEKENVKKAAKEHLEGLLGKVPTLRTVKVNIEPLSSSNCDMMLDTSFDDEEGLKAYAVHPCHVEVANTYVRPFTSARVCFDFKE